MYRRTPFGAAEKLAERAWQMHQNRAVKADVFCTHVLPLVINDLCFSFGAFSFDTFALSRAGFHRTALGGTCAAPSAKITPAKNTKGISLPLAATKLGQEGGPARRISNPARTARTVSYD
jgi:hypothetical protein